MKVKLLSIKALVILLGFSVIASHLCAYTISASVSVTIYIHHDAQGHVEYVYDSETGNVMSAYWVVDQEAYDEPVSSTETISIDIPNSISPSEVNSILASISPSSDLSLSVVSWGETAEEIREAYTSAKDTHVSDELHAADIERLKENIKASTCEVIASLAETIGDPVQLGTGAFSFAETDLQYSFASSYILVQRHYSSAVGCSHSFGPGWACNLDTRIIRGSDYRAQEEADLIKQKLDFTKEQYSASVGKREAGLQYLDNTVLPFLYEKRNKLQVAINELDAAIATASYSEIITAITNDRNNAYNALQLVDSKITETLAVRSSLDSTLEEIEKMKALIEQYSMQYSQAQREADLAADNISLNRFTVNASDPEYATYTGNGTVTLVDESGTTRIYHIVEKPDYETTHTLPDGSKNYYSDGSTLTSDQPFDDVLELLADGSFVRTKKDGTRLQYSYLGQLSSIVDANGNTISFYYSDSGKLASLSDDYGRVTTFTRSGDRITGIAGPAGRSVTYGYSDGRLTSVTDSAGDTVTYSYDGNLLTSIGKPDGSSRTYIYGDYEGKKVVISTIDEEGKIERFRYFPGYTEYENASGVVETYYIDERYRTTRVVHADGTYRSMEYDEHDNVIAETDELGRRTSYTYDERRNRLSAIDPAGYSERWSYAADDTVLSYTDKAGRTTWYSYDTKRNLVLIEYPDGTKESFEYDGRGRLTARTDRNGGKTKFELDAYGYICRSTDPSGASWNYINDTIGQVLQAEDPVGAKTHYEYNGDGKVVKITDDAGAVETFVYDNRKDLIRMTDKRGYSTEYKYDNRHLLTRVVNACGDVVGYEYRADGKVIEKRIGKLQRDARTVEGHGAFGTASSTSVGISLGEAAQTVVDQEAGRAARLALLRDAGTTEAAAPELDPNLDGARVIWESHTIFAYDVRGMLSSTIQSETGIKTEAEYYADGRLKSLRDAEGAVTSFGYDNVGRLAWEEDPMLNKTSYTYTPVGKVQTMTDRRGMVTRYEYDRADRLISVTDAAGESEYYEYDGNGNLTQVTDKEGAKTRIRYDAMNRPLSLQDALGGIETYEYDARGLMTRKTDKGGASTSYTYDRLGRLISVTDAAGKVTRNRYDAAGNLIGATDRRGSTWGWVYDELGRVVKEIDPYEHITSYTYTTLGDVATVTNALGETWERRYDAVGRLIAEIDPLRYATSFAYDGNGRLISVTDAAGRVEKYSYDTLGRLSYSSKLGEVRFFQYDPEGNRIAETDPTGAVHSYEYDELGRLTRETDRLSKSSLYAYDREGRLVAKTDFSGDITKYTYDKLGRQTKVEFPDGSSKSFAYDSRGNLIKAENAARKYEFSYDLLGRLTSVRDFDLGEEITYVYDPEGARTSISWQNGKRITRYTYGKAGELLTVTDAEGGVTSFAYDELVREVKRIQSNGISTLRSYDPAGRLSKVKTEGGPSNQKKLSSEAYVYDPSGKRIYTVDEKGQITAYRYDAEGRLSEVLYPFASGKPAADFGERLHYGLYPTYDSHSPNTHNGKKNESGAVLDLGLRMNISGFDTEAFLDELGKQLDDQDAVIREAAKIAPGLGGRWKLDQAPGATPFFKSLDPTAEEITALKAAAIRANGRNGYINTNPYQWVERYEYDSRNNRSAKANGWGRIDYSYDAENRLLQAGKRSYQYDADGNLVMESIGTVQASIAYDFENRPVDAYTKLPGFYGSWYGSKVENLKAGVRYEYDALGRRVERVEYTAQQFSYGFWGRAWNTESAVNYLYDGLSMDILAEARDWDYNPGDIGLPYLPWCGWGQWGHHGYSRPFPWGRPGYFSWTGSFKPESEYVYAKGAAGNGEVIERMDFNPTKYSWGHRTDTEYYTSDILGSTMMLTDKHGQVRERYEYDAFGSLYEGAFARLNAVGYTGKRYDAKSGRYDYGFREYSPSLGRFTTSDPIRSGANWYVYCTNEPVNYTDPFGLEELYFDSRLTSIKKSSLEEAQEAMLNKPMFIAGNGGYTNPSAKPGTDTHTVIDEKTGKEKPVPYTYCNQTYYYTVIETLGRDTEMLPLYKENQWDQYGGQLITAAQYGNYLENKTHEKNSSVYQLSGSSAQLLGDLGMVVAAVTVTKDAHIATVAASTKPYNPAIGPMLANGGQIPSYNGIKDTAFAFGSHFDEVKYYSDLKQK